MKLYMKVENDEYALPVVIAKTVQELADKCGMSKATMSRRLSQGKEYLIVEVEDED